MTIENHLMPPGKNRDQRPIHDLRSMVMHWVENPNTGIDHTRNWFIRGEVFGSYHYIIDIQGRVGRIIPENERAFHCGSRVYEPRATKLFGADVIRAMTTNNFSLGIGLCHPDWTGKFTRETIISALKLCADILYRHNKSEGIISTHYEITGKNCPRYWQNNHAKFEAFVKSVGQILAKKRAISLEAEKMLAQIL